MSDSKSTEETLRDKVEAIEYNGYLGTRERAESILQLFDRESRNKEESRIEAKIQVIDKYLAYRSDSDFEFNAIAWLDNERTELRGRLGSLAKQGKEAADE